MIIGTDGNNCPLLRESTIFTSKCNGSKIETRVLKQFPEIGDGVKFENDQLTLPARSSLVGPIIIQLFFLTQWKLILFTYKYTGPSRLYLHRITILVLDTTYGHSASPFSW